MIKKIFILLIILFLSSILYAETYQQYTERLCIEYDVPYEVAFAIATVESNWRNVEGCTGDIGIFQLNPNYVEYFADMYWEKLYDFDPWNPKHNIEIGISYLKCLYERNDNSWEKAIMAYHIGNYALHYRYSIDTWQYERANRYYFQVCGIINKM